MEKLLTQINFIILPDAPQISGLSFRGFQGESDYPKMVAVITGCKDEDKIERVDTVKDVARTYKYLVNCDPYQDMLFAEIDGEVIGYQRVLWREEVDGNRIYITFGFLLPAWRNKGIGTVMLRHAERRLQEIAASHTDYDKPRYFETQALNSEVLRQALYQKEGYKAIRYAFDMVRPDLENIPDLSLPEGIEIRPVLPEHYQTIRDASMEAFLDEWGFSPELEPPVEEWLENPNFDPSLWQVAWDGDRVVGMVLNFIDQRENKEYKRKRGYTENICVRRPWRKRGIAKALIAASLRVIKERDMEEAALGVDAENPSGALQLYESMGYRMIRRYSIYRKPLNN
ncbi:MAG: GNAT family N-acetyltransferase [Anaerolineales bacterium]|nr:GNAT family N-acetyltransferase [Anaerolineales bacterium]